MFCAGLFFSCWLYEKSIFAVLYANWQTITRVYMYNHIRGRLVEKNPAFVIIEANGIGFQINISLHTYSQLPNQEAVLLYTHLVVKEDGWQMYGFADQEERRIFQLLISVSGVGPNTARVILSSLGAAEVESAILMENVGLLTAIKGIGAKTAQRLVIDLKDKIGKGITTSTPAMQAVGSVSNHAEAVSALEILGFNRIKVEKVVASITKASTDLNVEDIIKEALKKL